MAGKKARFNNNEEAGQQQKQHQLKQQKKSDNNDVNNVNDSLNIVAGTYERLLYGFNFFFNKDKNTYDLKPMFMFPAHITCIKSLALSPPPDESIQRGGKWLVTGGTDESIKVWDMRRKVEVGSLTGTEGTPLTLSFINSSHLVIGTTHSMIYIFKAGDWSLLKSFKAHKGSVDGAAVHPHGGFAMSVGDDRMGQLWKLGKNRNEKRDNHVGRIAGTKLGIEGRKGNPESVKFSKSGDIIAILFKKHLELRKSSGFELLPDLPSLPSSLTSKLHDMDFYKPSTSNNSNFSEGCELLAVASEDKRVLIYEINEQSPYKFIIELVGHQNRVKSVRFGVVNSKLMCVSISSDGLVRVFDLSGYSKSNDVVKLECVASYNTKGARLTCLDVAKGGLNNIVDESSDDEQEQEQDEENEEQELENDQEEE